MIYSSRFHWLNLILALVLLVAVFSPAVRSQQDDANKLTVPLDGVKVIQTNSSISRVVTGKSSIVKIQVINSQEVAIFGLETGVTTLHIWTDRGLRQNLLAVEEVGTMSMGDNFRSILTQDEDVQAGEQDMEMRVFSPEYRDVSEFENYINELLKDDGKVILSDPPSGKIFVVGKKTILDKIEELMSRLDVPGQEKIYSKRIVMENRPVTQIADQIEKMLSDQGRQIVDRETNSIMIVDQVSKVNSVENYMNEIDVPTVAQVRIEARFVEMSDLAQKELGVDWQVDGARHNQTTVDYGFSTPGLSSSGLQLDISNLGVPTLDAQLQALEQKNLVNLISSPNVVTRNQQQANLTIQNQTSYVSGCQAQQIEGAQSIVPVIDQINDGITLEVTPLIGKNRVIQLDVVPELRLATLGNATQFGTSDCTFFTPNVDVRRAKLNVALRDGQTLVIGGLDRKEERDNSTSVPLFSDIPLLGYAFKQDDRTSDDLSISIFLTAKIVKLHKKTQPDTRPRNIKGGSSTAMDTVPRSPLGTPSGSP